MQLLCAFTEFIGLPQGSDDVPVLEPALKQARRAGLMPKCAAGPGTRLPGKMSEGVGPAH